MSINTITHFLPATFSKTPSLKNPLGNQTVNAWGVPQAWIEAAFCDDKGFLCFSPSLRTKYISLNELLNRWIEIGYKHVSMRSYFDALIQAFSDIPCKLYLRGSYATYLLNPVEELREILNEFIQQNPSNEHLIENGFLSLQPLLPIFKEPDDSDWALLWEDPPSELQLIEIKNRLIAINASFGEYSLDFAEKHTFHNLFTAKINPLTQFADPIVIASLQGKPKLDLVVGFPKIAPYLFTCDDHYIRIGFVCTPEVKPQAIFDACLGIIRAEERHEMDFRALMKAVKHRSQGKKWDESKITFRRIFNRFLELPTEILTEAIQKKIDEEAVEPISFVLNLLALTDHPARLQELWNALKHYVTMDPFVSFEEACSGVALYKERFPSRIGDIPFTEVKSLYPLKGVLLKHLHEFRPPTPREFDRVMSHIAAQGWLDENEERLLANHFGVENLFFAFLQKGLEEEALSYLCRKQQSLSLSQLLDALKQIPDYQRHTQHFLASFHDKEEAFLVCLEKDILLPDDFTKSIFRGLFSTYTGPKLIEWLKKVGSKIKSDHKEWVVDLWIELTKEEKIPLSEFKLAVENWLKSRLPDRIKLNCLLRIWHLLGSKAFTEKAKLQATALFAEAQTEDLVHWFLELDNLEPFFHAHKNRLERDWEILFHHAKNKQRVLDLLPCFQHSLHFPQILKLSLSALPDGERLKWIYPLDASFWGEMANELSPEENNHLELERLRRTHSYFLWCALKRRNVPVPEKLTEAVLKNLRQTKSFKGDQIISDLRELVEAFQWVELFELLPKLEPSLKEETLELIRRKIQKSIALADLKPLKMIIKNREFQKFIPITPTWIDSLKITEEHACDIWEMIESTDFNGPLGMPLCLLYLPMQRTGQQEIAFAKVLFAQAPKRLPAPLSAHLLDTVIKEPIVLNELITMHRQWLLDQGQSDAERVYQFLTLLHQLKIPLPKNIPACLIDLVRTHLSHTADFFFALDLLSCNGTQPLKFLILAALIRENNLEAFQTWLQSCLSSLNAVEQNQLLNTIDSYQRWMEELLQALRSNALKNFKSFTPIILERYLEKHGHATTLPFLTLIQYPVRNYTIFAPLLNTEEQSQEFLQWLDPPKAELPGVRELFAHLIQESLKKPSPGPLIHKFGKVYFYLKNSELFMQFAKRALKCRLEEGLGCNEWLRYASTEIELRQSIACIATQKNPSEISLILFDEAITLSRKNPELCWGEDFAKQVYHIIRYKSVSVNVHSIKVGIDLLSLLVRDQENLKTSTRIKLLLQIAQHSETDQGLNAYRQLLTIIETIPDLKLEVLEKMATLLFFYPKVTNTALLNYLTKQPISRPTEELELRYSMLAYLGLVCLKTPANWQIEPTLEYLILNICSHAQKLGTVDLTKAPYIQVLGKAFSVLGRLNPGLTTRLFDSISEIAMKYSGITDPLIFCKAFVPKFIDYCFRSVDLEDFQALLIALQLVNVIALKYYSQDIESRDKLLIAFIEKAIYHKFYQGNKEETNALLTSISCLSRIQDRYYYSLFLLDDETDLETRKFFFKKLTIKESTERIDAAIQRAFFRRDVTGSLIIYNAFQRSESFRLMTEHKRRKLLQDLIPFLKDAMPDRESALFYFKKILKISPPNPSKKELKEMDELIQTLEDQYQS